MEACKDEREPSNIPELIKRTKCEQRSCPNYDHNCLVMPGQKHFSLTANDFCNWNKAIDMGKATLDLPPLNIRGSPVAAKKSQVAITQNTTNTAVPFPFSFMPGFPMSGYAPPYSPYPPHIPYSHVAPGAPHTPVRQAQTMRQFSSPIDTGSEVNSDVVGFMNWMISRAKDNVLEVEALEQTKAKFLISMDDLDLIKTMNAEGYDKLGIVPGLGRRLSRDVKQYIISKK